MSKYLEWKRRAFIMSADQFFLPPGLSTDDVLAAYQFKGQSSQNDALMDMSGHGRALTVGTQTDYQSHTHTPTWDSSKGFTWDAVYQGASGYLDNAELDLLDIQACVVRYSGLTQGNRGYLVNAGGSSGRARLYAAATAAVYGSAEEGDYSNVQVKNYGGPGFVSSAWSSWTHVGTIGYTTAVKTACVVGANFITNAGKGLWIDGNRADFQYSDSGATFADVGVGNKQGYTFSDQHRNMSNLNNAVHAGKTIIAAVFFRCELSPDQHEWVANKLAAF